MIYHLVTTVGEVEAALVLVGLDMSFSHWYLSVRHNRAQSRSQREMTNPQNPRMAVGDML